MHAYMYNACTFLLQSEFPLVSIFINLNGLGIFIPLNFDYFYEKFVINLS